MVSLIYKIAETENEFEQIFELRAKTNSKLTETEANSLFSDYMTQIERVIEAVDRIESE